MTFSKLTPILAAAVVGFVVSLQAWTLKEIVDLKVQVAGLLVRVENIQHPNPALAQK